MNGAFGKIESGNLERSNVDVTSEMITMLKAQQAFRCFKTSSNRS